MYSPVFRSRWLALAFVVIMAMGAAKLVGDEKGGGVIGHATEQILDQRKEFARGVEDLRAGDEGDDGFASDEELVQDGAPSEPEAIGGFDPAPTADTEPAGDNAMGPNEIGDSAFVIVDGEVRIID